MKLSRPDQGPSYDILVLEEGLRLYIVCLVHVYVCVYVCVRVVVCICSNLKHASHLVWSVIQWRTKYVKEIHPSFTL